MSSPSKLAEGVGATLGASPPVRRQPCGPHRPPGDSIRRRGGPGVLVALGGLSLMRLLASNAFSAGRWAFGERAVALEAMGGTSK